MLVIICSPAAALTDTIIIYPDARVALNTILVTWVNSGVVVAIANLGALILTAKSGSCNNVGSDCGGVYKERLMIFNDHAIIRANSVLGSFSY